MKSAAILDVDEYQKHRPLNINIDWLKMQPFDVNKPKCAAGRCQLWMSTITVFENCSMLELTF